MFVCYFNVYVYGDWGLGIGDWGLGPIPNPQSPIPNPHIYRIIHIINLFIHSIIYIYLIKSKQNLFT